jgi:hypothetical protein
MALNGHSAFGGKADIAISKRQCPLLGEKRTLRLQTVMSVFDPKQTSKVISSMLVSTATMSVLEYGATNEAASRYWAAQPLHGRAQRARSSQRCR